MLNGTKPQGRVKILVGGEGRVDHLLIHRRCDGVIRRASRHENSRAIDFRVWHITTDIELEPNVGFRGTAEVSVGADQITGKLRCAKVLRCDGRWAWVCVSFSPFCRRPVPDSSPASVRWLATFFVLKTRDFDDACSDHSANAAGTF